MTEENLLMQKCLEITSHVLNKDQRVFINIKIGNSFSFTFNNQESNMDVKKKSPSVTRRDNDRKELFKENLKQEGKIESNFVDREKKEVEEIVDIEKKDVEKMTDKNCQIWKVKVFSDDIERLEYHVKEEKDSKVFKYSSKLEDKHRGAIKSVKSVQKYQNKDGNYAIMEIALDISQFSISFVENERNWPKFVRKVERISYI